MVGLHAIITKETPTTTACMDAALLFMPKGILESHC